MHKILVLEDEQAIAEVLDQFLSMSGFKVIKTLDGQRALEIIKTQADIDLLILDIKMPRMNGVSVLRKMKELGRNPPVIILTGAMNIAEYIDDLHKFGYNKKDIVFKPVDLYELLELVNKKLNR